VQAQARVQARVQAQARALEQVPLTVQVPAMAPAMGRVRVCRRRPRHRRLPASRGSRTREIAF